MSRAMETAFRARCEELGLDLRLHPSTRADRDTVVGAAHSEWSGSPFVSARSSDRETACRAALAALDVLYPR